MLLIGHRKYMLCIDQVLCISETVGGRIEFKQNRINLRGSMFYAHVALPLRFSPHSCTQQRYSNSYLILD